MQSNNVALRTGDIVLHGPSGEEWVVGWADAASGDMAPCGWPTCQARIADCIMIRAATDHEHAELVAQFRASRRTDSHRAILEPSHAE